MTEATERVNHPLFARLYMRMTSGRKAQGEDEHRRKLLAGLTGRVIEVGAGNGLNFALYPETVQEVVAVEPEPSLRKAAVAAATEARCRGRLAGPLLGSRPMGASPALG